MATQLDPTGVTVEVGQVRLRTPGLTGQVDVFIPAAADARGQSLSSPQLERALEETGAETQLVLSMSEVVEVPMPGVEARSTAFDEAAFELEVPDAGPDFLQAVMAQDEAGVTTWNFPVDDNDRQDVSRAAATRRYLIRRHPAPTPPAGSERSVLSGIGMKVLKVVAFKLIDPVMGVVGPHFARKWEEKKRAYRIRTFTPGDYNQEQAGSITDWKAFAGKRALLMIHGTISRTNLAFGSMDQPSVKALVGGYDGRALAFDHFTLSDDPRTNIERFVAMLPDDANLDVDIICHSRGGLVARQLAEQQAALSLGAKRIRVNRIVFVATPNSGTLLADTKYMTDFIDTYTNLLNFVPDNGATEIFEGIITVAKLIAAGTVKGLDGLQSMHPSGTFLKGLNTGNADQKKYFAISSNYEPADSGLKSWVADRLLDRIFNRKYNDLVVPTEGVYGSNGSGFFPIAQRFELDASDGIAHTRFFGNAKVQRQLLSWLKPPST